MSKELFKSKMKPTSVVQKSIVKCQVCECYVGPNSPCDMTKNGYCQVSRFIAERDAVTFNMHPPRYQEEKT